jgi:hypothetical protein
MASYPETDPYADMASYPETDPYADMASYPETDPFADMASYPETDPYADMASYPEAGSNGGMIDLSNQPSEDPYHITVIDQNGNIVSTHGETDNTSRTWVYVDENGNVTGVVNPDAGELPALGPPDGAQVKEDENGDPLVNEDGELVLDGYYGSPDKPIESETGPLDVVAGGIVAGVAKGAAAGVAKGIEAAAASVVKDVGKAAADAYIEEEFGVSGASTVVDVGTGVWKALDQDTAIEGVQDLVKTGAEAVKGELTGRIGDAMEHPSQPETQADQSQTQSDPRSGDNCQGDSPEELPVGCL